MSVTDVSVDADIWPTLTIMAMDVDVVRQQDDLNADRVPFAFTVLRRTTSDDGHCGFWISRG